MLVEQRAYSHLRPPAHAPLDRASLPFDGFLPPWHHAHIAHAGAVLPVDRHELVHPVVAWPLLEVISTENPTTDCPLANHPHASPGRSWHRHECRLLRPVFRSRLEATPTSCSSPTVSVVGPTCSPSLPPSSPLRARPTFWSPNTFHYGGACAPYSRTTASSSAPSFHKRSTSVGSAQDCHKLL